MFQECYDMATKELETFRRALVKTNLYKKVLNFTGKVKYDRFDINDFENKEDIMFLVKEMLLKEYDDRLKRKMELTNTSLSLIENDIVHMCKQQPESIIIAKIVEAEGEGDDGWYAIDGDGSIRDMEQFRDLVDGKLTCVYCRKELE